MTQHSEDLAGALAGGRLMGELTEGQRIMKALNTWLESDEGKICLSPGAHGQYLRNRLIHAYQQGWNDARADAKSTPSEP